MTEKLTQDQLAEIRQVASMVGEELAVAVGGALCLALTSMVAHRERAVLWRETFTHKIFSGMEVQQAAVYADAACVCFDRQFKDPE